MPAENPPDESALYGRQREIETISALIARAKEHGDVLVIRGEPGIGKSAILAAASTEARTNGFQVLTATGVQSEAEVPFAGLDQLFRAMRWDADTLPDPQRTALLAKLSRQAAQASERLLLPLAQIQKQTGSHFLVGGCDLEADGLKAINDGYVYALASPEHWLKGYIAVKLLAQHAQSGKALPAGWWNPGALVVNRSNVANIIARQHDEASRARWFKAVVNEQFAQQSEYVKPLSAAT